MSRPVALVTGASRGVGRGIALGLGEAGWTVYVTGRGPASSGAPLATTAEQVVNAGGSGIAVVCDHRDDKAVTALVDRCVAEQGRLDVLVNNVWAGPAIGPVVPPFWERPLTEWDDLVGLGLRAHWVASTAACRHMVARGSGLVVNVSSFGARGYLHSVLYGVAKAGLDKMTHDMARELLPHGVAALSLWPGLVRTDALLSRGIEQVAGVPVAEGESPQLQGRVIRALAEDPDLLQLSGQALVTAEAAIRYGLTEPGGRTPPSLRHLFGGGPLFGPVAPVRREG
ncbi:NAD(P)-dependent dehydrogenase, short-chain alcohol dehydrogenase family [Blastococcus sp. DSM 46786]|uniref:SDR family NAD(P)-dependent oxidoreductase n=1 Tax=Blastococcus sp. DSM 46786 TaxID=1798227 RepID=UPI0008C196FF|nr:SDR family NAD(P)-dependent oxidoreductase [Blastococcus sp. DSM 46786]SEK73597.1 NAD(P)-dependent dehydrogenase, short-chain alcohol dehydrogenase family [Blastococcus sp. DSM 46786]